MEDESSDKKPEPAFTVIDRRHGRDQDLEKSERPEEAAPATKASPPPEAAKSSPTHERSLPPIDFSTFIVSLSTSALYHLGLVPDPETGTLGPPDLAIARQTIDTLEILRDKTRGNLEPAESSLIESLLYELRMRFVEASR